MTSAASSSGRRRIQKRRSGGRIARISSAWSRAGSEQQKVLDLAGRERAQSFEALSVESTGHTS